MIVCFSTICLVFIQKTIIVSPPLHKYILLCLHTDPSYASNIGIIGQNITFHFKFNTTITNDTRISIYKSERQEKKISQYSHNKSDIKVHSETSSVFYHMAHLTLNDTEVYWATLFVDNEPPILSNKVQLTVREDYRNTTGKFTTCVTIKYINVARCVSLYSLLKLFYRNIYMLLATWLFDFRGLALL